MIRKLFLCACLLVAGASCAVADNSPPGRIVAISDIHGAFAAMTETLQQAGIVAADGHWSGGNDELIVVGDMLDRGPGSRQVMEFMMALEPQALAAGGRVHVLIGNHEAMLLSGDMRYVSAAEYAAFAADESDRERADWLARYAAQHETDVGSVRKEFERLYPPGYFAMRRAFRSDGRYGRWLLEKDFVLKRGGSVFVHGGLSPEVAAIGIDGINRRLRKVLRKIVRARERLSNTGILFPVDGQHDRLQALEEEQLLSAGGPLWYRRNATCPTIVASHRLDEVLKTLDADRLIVGHTPTPGRKVLQRFDGRLFEIDTGMLHSHYGGLGHAVIVAGDDVDVVNQQGERLEDAPDHPRGVGARPRNVTAEDLGRLLANGDVVGGVTDKKDAARVNVRHEGQSVDAAFVEAAADGSVPGVAAYELDLLLGADLVPVTVRRAIDGREGSLQYLGLKTISESQREATGTGGAASCPLPAQWDAMAVFDFLAGMQRRQPDDMQYDKFDWRLLLAPNDAAFATRRMSKRALESASAKLTPGWQAALQRLDDETIDQQLGAFLSRPRLEALKRRRDRLLASLR